jgi:hypothetical protein
MARGLCYQGQERCSYQNLSSSRPAGNSRRAIAATRPACPIANESERFAKETSEILWPEAMSRLKDTEQRIA